MNQLLSIAVILALAMLHTTQASTTVSPGTGSGSGISSFSFKEAMMILNAAGGETTPSPADAGTFFVGSSSNSGSSNTVMTNVNLPSWPMPPTTQPPDTTPASPTDTAPSLNAGSPNSQWPSGSSSALGASSPLQWPSATGSGAGTSPQWPTSPSTTGGASPQWSGSDYLKQLISTMPRFTVDDIPKILDRIRTTKAGLASIGLTMTHRDLGQVLKDYQAMKAASTPTTANTGSAPSTSATDPAGIWSAFGNMVSTGQQQQPTASIPSSAFPGSGSSAGSSGSPSIMDMLQGMSGGTASQTSAGGLAGSSLMDMMQKMQSGMTGQPSATAGAGTPSIMDMMQKMQSGMTGQPSATAGAGTPSIMDMMRNMQSGMMGQTPTAGGGGGSPSVMDMLQKMQGGMTGQQTPTAGGYGNNGPSSMLGANQGSNYVMDPSYNPSVSGILPTQGKGSISGTAPPQQNQQQMFQNQLQNQLYKIQEQQKLINRLNTAGRRPQTSSNPLAAYLQQGQGQSLSQAATNPLAAMLQAQQQNAANPLAGYMQPKAQNTAAAANPLAAFFGSGKQNAGQTTAASPLTAFMQTQRQQQQQQSTTPAGANPLTAFMQAQRQQQQSTTPAGANPLAAFMQSNNIANPLAMMMQSQAKANPLAALTQTSPAAGGGMNLNRLMNSVMPQMGQTRPMQPPLGAMPDPWINSLLGPSSSRYQNPFGRPGMGGNSMFGGGIPAASQPNNALQALMPAMAFGGGMENPWGAMAMAQAMNQQPQVQQSFMGLMNNPLFLMNMATGGEMFSL